MVLPELKPLNKPATAEKFSRLRPVAVDRLEAVGLPSKGDRKLLDLQTQEDYFLELTRRYEIFKGERHNTDDALESSKPLSGFKADRTTIQVDDSGSRIGRTATSECLRNQQELTRILGGMRKLREAIVATSRRDAFAFQVYAFIIRATILLGHRDSYHPALLHLLRNLHNIDSPKDFDFQRFVGYYILELACHQNELGLAFQVRRKYDLQDQNVGQLLQALIRGDWVLYWKVYQKLDAYQQRLAQASHEKLRARVLQCFAAAYLSVEVKYLEGAVKQAWSDAIESKRPNWKREDQMVIIRRIKAKPSPHAK